MKTRNIYHTSIRVFICMILLSTIACTGQNPEYFRDKDFDDVFEKMIGDMKIGESGWTQGWAMFCKPKGCFLNGEYTIEDSPRGTADLKIIRKTEGFVVSVATSDYKWTVSEDAGDYYVGGNHAIPVHQIISR